jgi:hypothetical protein
MPTAHLPKQVEKGRRHAKTLCAIHEDEESLVALLGQPKSPAELSKLPLEEIGQSKLPPKLRKSPPKELGQDKSPPKLRMFPRTDMRVDFNNQIDTPNCGINCAVAAAASTLAYSLSYGKVGTASTQMQIHLTSLDALATSGSADNAGSE